MSKIENREQEKKIKKNEKSFHKHFSNFSEAPLLAVYSCKVLTSKTIVHKGKLFVTENHIHLRSGLVHTDKHTIPISAILSVEKVIEDGLIHHHSSINIVTYDKKYSISSKHTQQILELLQELIEKNPARQFSSGWSSGSKPSNSGGNSLGSAAVHKIMSVGDGILKPITNTIISHVVDSPPKSRAEESVTLSSRSTPKLAHKPTAGGEKPPPEKRTQEPKLLVNGEEEEVDINYDELDSLRSSVERQISQPVTPISIRPPINRPLKKGNQLPKKFLSLRGKKPPESEPIMPLTPPVGSPNNKETNLNRSHSFQFLNQITGEASPNPKVEPGPSPKLSQSDNTDWKKDLGSTIISNFKKPIKFAVDSISSEQQQIQNKKVSCNDAELLAAKKTKPSGLLYKLKIQILKGKCLGSFGGYCVFYISDFYRGKPFFKNRTKKSKHDNPEWNETFECTILDDRCIQLCISCKTSVDVTIGTSYISITDFSQYLNYCEWVQLFDQKSPTPRCLVQIGIQFAVIEKDKTDIVPSVTSKKVQEVDLGASSEIASMPKLSAACKVNLHVTDREQPTFDPNQTIPQKYQSAPPKPPASPRLLKRRNRGVGGSRTGGSAIEPERKRASATITEKPTDILIVPPNACTTLDNFVIPFQMPGTIFAPSRPIVDYKGKSSRKPEKIVPLEPPSAYTHTFDLNSNIITIPFIDLQTPCFHYHPVQLHHLDKRRALIELSQQQLPKKWSLPGGAPFSPPTQVTGSNLQPVSANSNLETTEETKARIYEDNILKRRALNDISQLNVDVFKLCSSLGLGHHHSDLLNKQTTMDEWGTWRENFKSRIEDSLSRLQADVEVVEALQHPVHETWNYCKKKFSKMIPPEEENEDQAFRPRTVSKVELPFKKTFETAKPSMRASNDGISFCSRPLTPTVPVSRLASPTTAKIVPPVVLKSIAIAEGLIPAPQEGTPATKVQETAPIVTSVTHTSKKDHALPKDAITVPVEAPTVQGLRREVVKSNTALYIKISAIVLLIAILYIVLF